MHGALAGWAFSLLTLAAPEPQGAGSAQAVAPVRIQVSFKLDPRLAGATYGGERWVSPPTYTGASAQDRVEIRAQELDAGGRAVNAAFRWIADPALVSVTPDRGPRVTIAVRRAGESTLRIASERGSLELVVRAIPAGEALRVEIVQPAAAPAIRAAPRDGEAAQRALADRARERSEASRRNGARGEAFLAANRARPGVVVLPGGVQYEVLAAGTGPRPGADELVTFRYRCTLVDGTELASSRRHGRAATTSLARLIPGFRQALALMPVGSRWKVVVPPRLAYGPRGTAGRRGAAPLVGPNETLVYEVELLAAAPRGGTAHPARPFALAPTAER